jgi:hypothetical protein
VTTARIAKTVEPSTGEIAAFHEAGHAWAYYRHDLPLRYATIRPRQPGVDGICRPWKPRRISIDVRAFVATAGPVAEALHWYRNDPDRDTFHDSPSFEDCLLGAQLLGGHDDRQQACGMLDDPDTVALVRELLELDWQRLEVLAKVLADSGTVAGPLLKEILS